MFDWTAVQTWQEKRSKRGRPAHPEAASLKAFLIRIREGMSYTTQLRRFLLAHPLLILDLGFHLILDPKQPYGFDPEETLPCEFWLREKLRHLDQALLQALLAATVRDLKVEIPGLGEVVAFDVKHIYAKGAKKTIGVPGSRNVLTKPRSRQAILTANWASSALPIKSKTMGRPKRKKN